MTTALEQIDTSLPVDLCPCQHDLDFPVTRGVEGVNPITLSGSDVHFLLNWAKRSWRPELEENLQSLAEDSQGRKLFSTEMPLVTFRERFCNGGRQMQDSETIDLMTRLRAGTRSWRAAGVDTVLISGRAISDE